MEVNYHDPDPFRFSLNSFLRAAKEIPTMLTNSVQSMPGVKAEIDKAIKELRGNDLFSVLGKRRDFVVHHRGMLDLYSYGSVGTTEGQKVKVRFPFRVDPRESSDEAYERYKALCRSDKFLRGLGPDCDSAPAVWRTWMLKEFPGRDLLEVVFEAWSLAGTMLSRAVVVLGGAPLDLSMPCRHEPEIVKIKRFSQHEFFLTVDGFDLGEDDREVP
jgi:hypothetical protein